MIQNIMEYAIEYFEIEKKGWIEKYYKPCVRVYKDNDILLSSEYLENEEFYNCLKFLVPNNVFDLVREILEHGYDREQYLDNYFYDDDYYDDCCDEIEV